MNHMKLVDGKVVAMLSTEAVNALWEAQIDHTVSYDAHSAMAVVWWANHKSIDDATMEQLEQVVDLLSNDDVQYMIVDSIYHTDTGKRVIKVPAVGDEVSYAFNGDFTPCGRILTVSPSLKRITTSEGRTFYRTGKESGVWKTGGTWSLIQGHVSRRNPEF